MEPKTIVLNVNGIEVIYNHVILVLKGVSLQVPEGSIVAILAKLPKARLSCAVSVLKICRPPTWCSAAWSRSWRGGIVLPT